MAESINKNNFFTYTLKLFLCKSKIKSGTINFVQIFRKNKIIGIPISHECITYQYNKNNYNQDKENIVLTIAVRYHYIQNTLLMCNLFHMNL